MVSRLAVLPLLAAVALLGGFGFAGCSSSDCLRADCGTSAPVEAAGSAGLAGGSNSAGSSGSSSSAGGPSTLNQACESNAECHTETGELCVEGTCRLACATHFDCQGFGECKTGTDTDGSGGHFCELGTKQPRGQFYARCPKGDADCDTDNGFFCVGAGGEDLDAYCTNDCTTDAACAAGFACTPLIRVTCEDTCGVGATPKDRSCIPAAQIGEGKAWQCGTRGATRSACRPRKFCNGCETDEDCLAAPNQICAKDSSGAKICTQRCDPLRPSCPWGNAAKCGVWDEDLGVATCMHRFGQCAGTGKGCEPCVTDRDCGSNSVCTSSSFTGERWCVDFDVRCSCSETKTPTCLGGGCPKSPGNLNMLCVDSTPSTANSGVCAGANTVSSLLASPQTGCWPEN